MSDQAQMAEFEGLHGELEELLRLIRTAALTGAWAAAESLLLDYELLLHLHIQHEERCWLSLHAEAIAASGGQRTPRWQAEPYHKEHRKLEKLLGELRRDLAALRTRASSPSQQAHQAGSLSEGLLGWLEACSRFINLSEHHHERERQGLFPELEAWLPPALLAEQVQACRQEWAEQSSTRMAEAERARRARDDWKPFEY